MGDLPGRQTSSARPSPPRTGPGRAGLVDLDQVVRVVMPMLGLLFLVAKSVHSATAPLTNSDTFFHLRFGAEFLDGWRPWDPGQPSEASTADWVPTQWLPQVLLAVVDRAGGLPALNVLYGVLLLSALGTWYVVARRAAGPLVAVVVTAVTWMAAAPTLSLRPQVISFVLSTVTVVVWSRTRATGRSPWVLVPIVWIWANSHGMWILGVAASVVLAVGVVIERKGSRSVLLVPPAMMLAASLTPAGPRLVLAVVEVNSRAQYFGEWGPPKLVSSEGLAALALLAACVASFLGDRSASPFEAALLLVGATFLVYSARTVPVAAAVLLPLAADRLQHLVGPRPSVGRPERVATSVAFAVGLAALVLIAPVRADEPPGVTAAAAALDSLPADSRVLTDSDTGGYLLWSQPDLDVPVHGYGDVFTDDELALLNDLFRLAPGWHDTLASLDVDAALLPTKHPLRAALEDRGWDGISRDEGRTFLLPPDGR